MADDFTKYFYDLGYNVTDDNVEHLFEILEPQIRYVALVHVETFLLNTIDPSRQKEGK